MHKQPLDQLRKQLFTAKSPEEVGRLVRENNITKVVVHPLHIHNFGDKRPLLEKIIGSDLKKYDQYVASISGLFKDKEDFKNTVFIFENSIIAGEAKGIFSKYGVEFAPAHPPVISSSGAIDLSPEAPKKIRALEALRSTLEKSDSLLLAGIFLDSCVKDAYTSLSGILVDMKKKPNIIMMNRALTKTCEEITGHSLQRINSVIIAALSLKF